MRSYFINLISISIFIIFGCSSNIENEALVASWVNEDEGCRIELNKDFSFSSWNLPLDVQNQYLIMFDKNIKDWEGTWETDGEQVKLIFDHSYYNIFIDNPLIIGSPKLYIQLSEESGGSFIYLNKMKK